MKISAKPLHHIYWEEYGNPKGEPVMFLHDRDNSYILENVWKIKNIPIYIVHGRYDQVCPLFQAEELVKA